MITVVKEVKTPPDGKKEIVPLSTHERETDAWQWINDNKHEHPDAKLRLEFEY